MKIRRMEKQTAREKEKERRKKWLSLSSA